MGDKGFEKLVENTQSPSQKRLPFSQNMHKASDRYFARMSSLIGLITTISHIVKILLGLNCLALTQ